MDVTKASMSEMKTFLQLRGRSVVGLKNVLAERVKGVMREEELLQQMSATAYLSRIQRLPALPPVPQVMGNALEAAPQAAPRRVAANRKRKGTAVDHVRR
jgi:hypothetical protein